MTSKKEGGNRKAQNLQIKGLIQAKMTLPNSPSPVPAVSYLKNSPKNVESTKLMAELNNAKAICLIQDILKKVSPLKKAFNQWVVTIQLHEGLITEYEDPQFSRQLVLSARYQT